MNKFWLFFFFWNNLNREWTTRYYDALKPILKQPNVFILFFFVLLWKKLFLEKIKFQIFLFYFTPLTLQQQKTIYIMETFMQSNTMYL